MLNPSLFTLQYVYRLISHLPEPSALSTLLICKKVLKIVSTSDGYRIRLDLRIRLNPPNPRVYKSQIGIYCQGKQPRPDWYSSPHHAPQSTLLSANQLIEEWTRVRGYVMQYSQHDNILQGLIRGFQEICNTIKDCETCTRILVPIEHQYLDWDAAEFFVLN